jgi:hypothetical protein
MPEPFDKSGTGDPRHSLTASPARTAQTIADRDALPAQSARRLPAPRPPGRQTPAGPLQSRRCPSALPPESEGLHTNPSGRNDAGQQPDPRATTGGRLSVPSDTLRMRRNDVVVLRLAPPPPPLAARGDSQAVSPALPRHDARRRPATGSSRDDAGPSFRANRQAFRRYPGSRNDAFQQFDPRRSARRSLPVPKAAAAALPLATNAIGAFKRIDKLSGRRGILVRLRGGRCDDHTSSTYARRMGFSTASSRYAPPNTTGRSGRATDALPP